MKAVILAGGEGTRLRPLTCNTPKPMVPILNRPFLEHMLGHLKGHGVDHAIVTLCYLPDKIKAHFGDGEGVGMHLSYMLEERPLGTAGAVKNVEEALHEAFFVLNGDIFTDLDLKAMVRFHREKRAQVTLFLTPVENPASFGVVETDPEGRVLRFLEKPSPGETSSNWINGGVYFMEPQALSHAPAREFHMFERGLFPRLLELGVPVYGYRARPYWMDVGTPASYLRVHRELLLGSSARPGIEPGDENSQIHPSAQVLGPVLLGQGCRVEPGSVIRGPAVLGAGCVVGQGALVQGSVLWRGVSVERGASLIDCIIGDGARIGEGTTVGEGCIVGDNVTLGKANRIEGGMVLWPGESPKAGTISTS
ncbi:MAG: Nucleotidyl transferase [Dehalococcoidia bacterium]|nr:Nucleotidyl transferase [Dehalococcoidia bacterium]